MSYCIIFRLSLNYANSIKLIDSMRNELIAKNVHYSPNIYIKT